MEYFKLPKKAARLIVLQRIELISPLLAKIRKLFGRYLFSNFVTRFFLDPNTIKKKYYKVMVDEFSTLERFIGPNDKFFLSIGGGISGLESIINKKYQNNTYYFIEKNYISKKVKYGWGGTENKEGYNDLNLQKNFLKMNGLSENQINIYDFDKDKLPEKKFDVIISLFSLDYHYDFRLYQDYLKKVSKSETKIIFDTIRADYFSKIFKKVEIIKTDTNTVHKSKRVVCNKFLDLN
tara:strand:+ start:605 stop:1312 length:708 start_codon:yes stop_codon:yes gene_type:complete